MGKLDVLVEDAQHVKMVCRITDMSTTNHACRTRGIRRTTQQTDKQAALPNTRNIFVTCYDDVARVGHVREDATRKLLPWNLGLRRNID